MDMSGSATALPPGFKTLERFVAAWAHDTAEARHHARLDSNAADRQAFFDAAVDLLAPGLDFLDQKRLAALAPEERRLMSLLLGLAHVSLAVELQGSDEPKHAAVARYMTVTRAPADQ